MIENLSKKIRKKIVELSFKSKSAHLGSCLSLVEILLVVIKFSKKKKSEIIFSKGHAAMAYYIVLKNFNYIKNFSYENYLKKKSKFWAHITKSDNNFLKFSFGSLGYGLGIAAGLAVGYKNIKKKTKIFCILSDGELNEGTIWESLMFISHHQLSNIITLIDFNKFQSFGKLKEVINLESYKKKFESFNFSFQLINGHNIKDIEKAIKKKTKKPKIIMCSTVKGKGIPRMENKLFSHYKPAEIADLNIFL
jgi:transketolase